MSAWLYITMYGSQLITIGISYSSPQNLGNSSDERSPYLVCIFFLPSLEWNLAPSPLQRLMDYFQRFTLTTANGAP